MVFYILFLLAPEKENVSISEINNRLSARFWSLAPEYPQRVAFATNAA